MASTGSSRPKRKSFAVTSVGWVLSLTRRVQPCRHLIFLVLLLAAVMFTTWHGVQAAGFLARGVAIPSMLLNVTSILSWGAFVMLALLLAWLERMRRKARDSSTRNDRLRRIYQLTNAVGRSETIETIYQEALNALAQSLKADRAAVLLFNGNGRMCFKAWRGLSEQYRKTVEGHSPWPSDSRNPEPIAIA